MQWPPTASDSDIVIFRDETTDGLRFVVHTQLGPQFSCRTFADAEERAFAFAGQPSSQVWFTDGFGLRILDREDYLNGPRVRRQHRIVDATNRGIPSA